MEEFTASHGHAGKHRRRHNRGEKLDRLQIQIAPAQRGRIEKLAEVIGSSYSGVAAQLIELALPELEKQYAARLEAVATSAG